VACLVIHGTDEPVADFTCWSDSDSDSGTLVCALHGLVRPRPRRRRACRPRASDSHRSSVRT
jgi:hypothetical protein